MSSGKKHALSATNNPFDSDYSSGSNVSHEMSELSQSRGVTFDLDTIAASRRAMIGGKSNANKTTKKLITICSCKKSSTSRGTTMTKTSRKSTPARPVVIDSDLESGSGRPPDEKFETRRTLNESAREPDAADDKISVMQDADHGDNASSSSMSNNSASNDESDIDDNSYASIDDLKERRNPYVYGILGLVSLALLSCIIALSVIIFGGKDGGRPPTPFLTARQEALHTIIKTVVNPSVLLDQVTSQYRAHQWLLYEDLLGLAPASGVSSERVIQRYSLAVFFFATGGARKWKSHNWLDGDECVEKWEGVGCTDDGIVHVLSLNNHGLSGTIPQEIGYLSLLEHLILKNNNELVGFLPSTLGKLQYLRQVGVYNNNIRGTIPENIFQVSSLKFINVQNNDLSGTLSPKVESLNRLETLVVMNNKMTGEIPFGSLSSTKVKLLGLSHNKFSGTIDPLVGILDKLEYLYLDGNFFVGQLPNTFSHLSNLKSLSLEENDVSGHLPELGELTNLEFLSIQKNSFVGQIPELGSLAALNNINLSQNAFTGPIPDLSKLKELRNLFLYHNKLTGSIPDSLFLLANLETLFLSSNHLTSTVPGGIASLKGHLRGLYLSDNHFEGSIPEALCELQLLEALLLDENSFEGTVPSCFGEQQRLRQLYVFDNQLTGELPIGLTELTWLTGLGLERNGFRGSIPLEICSLKDNKEKFDLWADCGGGFPDLTCPCCSVCCPSLECE